jgi:hypothetical protein
MQSHSTILRAEFTERKIRGCKVARGSLAARPAAHRNRSAARGWWTWTRSGATPLQTAAASRECDLLALAQHALARHPAASCSEQSTADATTVSCRRAAGEARNGPPGTLWHCGWRACKPDMPSIAVHKQ